MVATWVQGIHLIRMYAHGPQALGMALKLWVWPSGFGHTYQVENLRVHLAKNCKKSKPTINIHYVMPI